MFAIFVRENKTVRFLEKSANGRGKNSLNEERKGVLTFSMRSIKFSALIAEFPKFQAIAKARQDMQLGGKGRAKKAEL